jgi:hypothetical protein
MGFDFHGFHYQITSIRRMLIGMGNHASIYENGSLHFIERWREESYGSGQKLPERRRVISWPAIEHRVRSELNVHFRILQIFGRSSQYQNGDVFVIPPSNGWANRNSQPNAGMLSAELLHL